MNRTWPASVRGVTGGLREDRANLQRRRVNEEQFVDRPHGTQFRRRAVDGFAVNMAPRAQTAPGRQILALTDAVIRSYQIPSPLHPIHSTQGALWPSTGRSASTGCARFARSAAVANLDAATPSQRLATAGRRAPRRPNADQHHEAVASAGEEPHLTCNRRLADLDTARVSRLAPLIE